MVNMKKIMTFLDDFSKNNNRDWFHDHTQERRQITLEFESLVEELELKISSFDNSINYYPPKELTFKQVRDTRFSKDKTPYNPSFRAHIAPKGKLPIPVGYFICLKPNDESFIGGGLFADMFSDATSKIREYLSNNTDEFERIITGEAFKKNFSVNGTNLKNIPKQYNNDSAVADYLKYKSWYLEYPITDTEIYNNNNLIELFIEKFQLMKDFNDFLNKALIGFRMPNRK